MSTSPSHFASSLRMCLTMNTLKARKGFLTHQQLAMLIAQWGDLLLLLLLLRVQHVRCQYPANALNTPPGHPFTERRR